MYSYIHSIFLDIFLVQLMSQMFDADTRVCSLLWRRILISTCESLFSKPFQKNACFMNHKCLNNVSSPHFSKYFHTCPGFKLKHLTSNT